MRARNARRQSLSVALLGVVTGLLGGVAAALLFTTTIARRIDDATRNAQRLAIGDAVLPMTAAQDEVGMLAGAIERASVLLRERDEELQRRLRDVASANKELEAFSYSVSHDLRAPLRHIAGFASLLEKRVGDRFDAESTRYMQTIRDAAARMGRLVDDLLGFSRMGRAEMLHAFVNLDDVVREVVAEQSQDTAGRRIEWNTHALPTVRGDRALLRVALSNLVSNAIKYTGTRPVAKIEIGAEPPINGERILYVRDNGVGFDMAYGDKLFGVFQRLHAAEEFEGTGIGLANVRRIVQRHGGRTWAEGAVGRGATFFISLPA
jgi:light-regulated signal transduction histidine kinase (bacteriophytochrome)